MENQVTNRIIRNTLLIGVLVSAAFTLIIAVTAASLSGFEIVGRTVPFAYPWRLIDPTALSRLTALGGYLLHNLIVWVIIFLAKRAKPKYAANLRWFNWAMIGTNVTFIILHWMQSHLFFDGLAQNVPEISALGSVALLLIVVIILETPRRGLIFGKKLKFHEQFMQIVRRYHGYLFSWAIIYTFWYHPTEGTVGHLAGFFYMFMLLVQSILIFNRAHLNKIWTFFLEAFVLIHGTIVAVFQGTGLWPMFAFGFGAMIVLTQMYGLSLNTWAKRLVGASFITLTVVTYAAMGRLASIHEILRIPLLDYMVIFLLYGLFWVGLGIARLFRRIQPWSSASGVEID
jgi:uncharacterized membrane protein YhdT